jgi:hypothetical protein
VYGPQAATHTTTDALLTTPPPTHTHTHTHTRTHPAPQVRRATEFLYTLFERAEEEVVFVVTHSGFARSVLLAVGREPYRPVNAELVPIIVEQLAKRSPEDDDELMASDKGQQQ